MKHRLFLLIPFLGFADFSFAVSILDEELVTSDWPHINIKQLPSKNAKYTGKSNIVGDNFSYAKLPTIHQYNWYNTISTRFSAFLPTACAPQILEDTIDQFLPDYQRVYALHVQSLYPNEHGVTDSGRILSPHDPFALKPHYYVHHDAPTINEGKNYETQVQWTVVPGVGGLVEPVQGRLQDVGLLSDIIYTHGAPGSRNGVSGDVMHLKGLTIAKKNENDENSYLLIHNNVFYSLVAFTNEDGQKEAVITCHVTLRNRDVPRPEDTEVGYFYEVFNNARTLREGGQGLEREEYFRPILPELKKFLRWDAPENRSPIEEPTPPIAPVIEQQPVPVEEPTPPIAPVIEQQPVPNIPPPPPVVEQPTPLLPPPTPVIEQQPVPVKDSTSPQKPSRKASIKPQKRSHKSVSQNRRNLISTSQKQTSRTTKRVTAPRVTKSKPTHKTRRLQKPSMRKTRTTPNKRPVRARGKR